MILEICHQSWFQTVLFISMTILIISNRMSKISPTILKTSAVVNPKYLFVHFLLLFLSKSIWLVKSGCLVLVLIVGSSEQDKKNEIEVKISNNRILQLVLKFVPGIHISLSSWSSTPSTGWFWRLEYQALASNLQNDSVEVHMWFPRNV
jgi:hypothetical protein